MLFWTRHASFRRVDIYDPFARMDASSQLGDSDASNFTLKYSSIFRRSVISTWRRVRSTPRRVKNAIMTPMAYHRSLHPSVGKGEAIYRSFSFHGVNIWNYLSKHIPTNVSYNHFNKLTKSYVLNNDIIYRLV